MSIEIHLTKCNILIFLVFKFFLKTFFWMFPEVLNFSYQAPEGEKRSQLLETNILVHSPNFLLFSHFKNEWE